MIASSCNQLHRSQTEVRNMIVFVSWSLATGSRSQTQGGKDADHACTCLPNPLEKRTVEDEPGQVSGEDAPWEHHAMVFSSPPEPFSRQQGCSLYIGMITQCCEDPREKDTCCTAKRSWIRGWCRVPVLSPTCLMG
jgi:hypothetical protein